MKLTEQEVQHLIKFSAAAVLLLETLDTPGRDEMTPLELNLDNMYGGDMSHNLFAIIVNESEAQRERLEETE